MRIQPIQPIQPFEEFIEQVQNMNLEGVPMVVPDALPDALPRLMPIRLDGHHTILSPNIPSRYLVRQIGISWHRAMEEVFDGVEVGTRILVRRIIMFSAAMNNNIIIDYVITRVAHQTFLGYWSHQDVVYLENEPTPYPFDIDGYHYRDEILINYVNNLDMPAIALPLRVENFMDNEEGINPLGEGQAEGDMNLNLLHYAEQFLEPNPEQLSSNNLLSFRE